MHRTNKDLELTAWVTAFTLPKGTIVQLIQILDGIRGGGFVVRDAKRLMNLTGNTHDPKYRYLWIEARHVIATGDTGWTQLREIRAKEAAYAASKPRASSRAT
jgi:hypothetical protein